MRAKAGRRKEGESRIFSSFSRQRSMAWSRASPGVAAHPVDGAHAPSSSSCACASRRTSGHVSRGDPARRHHCRACRPSSTSSTPSRSKSADERRSTWTLWAKTIVACIPAAVVGLPLDLPGSRTIWQPFATRRRAHRLRHCLHAIETVRERRAQRLMAAPAAGSTVAASATSATGAYRPRHFSGSDNGASQPQQELTISQVADADARIQNIDDLD